MSTPVASISDDDQASSCFRGFNFPTSSSKPETIAQQLLDNRRIGRPKSPAEDYEALLNEGMKHLTFDEIQHEQELLHGVADESDLHENTVNDLLSSLQEHLNRTKTDTAYETAENRSPPYARNQEFQMAFLRANRFDPKESAEKIINFFRYKQELFGDECLVRDITTQDLDNDDLKCLLEGYFQYSLFRDQSGRKIFLEFPGVRSETSVRTELRARFYLMADALSTMVDLSRGCVVVSYLVEQYEDHLNGQGFIEASTLINTGVPMKHSGLHLCYSSPIDCMVTKAGIAMMPYRERIKTRVHFGSHVECQYLLASFGITRGALPLKGLNSEMDLSYHRAWFQGKVLEEKKDQQASVAIPLVHGSSSAPREMNMSHSTSSTLSSGNENDVLCLGRVVHGVGNQRLQSLALLYETAYENVAASNRRLIINGIIDDIYRHGGRFLKPDAQSGNTKENITWEELSPEERRKKVAQLFRNLRRRRAKPIGANASSVSALPALTPSGRGTDVQPSSPPVIVEHTRPEDVLFGQHRGNPGNEYLREIILDVADEYNRADRGDKKEITLRMVQKIHASGGRFLKKSDDGSSNRWEIVSDQAARERISKQFRNFRRKR